MTIVRNTYRYSARPGSGRRSRWRVLAIVTQATRRSPATAAKAAPDEFRELVRGVSEE